MTEKLYDTDSHLFNFKATVISCESCGDGFATVLDRTAFFPEGGGQGSDRGRIGEAFVSDVQLNGEDIVHITDRPFTVGVRLDCAVDSARRLDFMRQHTGEHIVSGIANRLYGCENVGFHLGEDIVTMDFDIPISREQISEIELLANKAVLENRPVFTYYPEREVLSGLKYRSKKDIDGALRIVEIEGIDVCACCAPHVKYTGEIGIIKVVFSERLRGGVRLEIKCGERAFRDYSERFESTAKIGDMLSVKYNETAAAAERLLYSFNELKGNASYLKKRLIEEKTAAFKAEARITALFEDGLDIKELQLYSDGLFKKNGGIRAVFCDGGTGLLFAVCGENEELNSFFKAFKEKFTVKGGGRGAMVQGTVYADKTEIIEFFENKKLQGADL